MTRLLSQVLDAPQPEFGHRIKQLERASGEPGADIRLSVDILQRTQNKIRELGLDPQDTTAAELYRALEQRLLDDEKRFREVLNLNSDAGSIDTLSAVLQFTSKLDLPRSVFALKTSTVKRLLKKVPPKKAMAHLGYRSVDSMIKHEPVAQIYAAAQLYEGRNWQDSYFKQYDSLHPGDFESRQAEILFPRSRHWEQIAENFASQRRHITADFKELGVTVVFPVQAEIPALGITSMLLVLDGLNAIRCASTYLKMQQMSPSFGQAIRGVATSDPTTGALFAGQALPWRLVQYFYHRVREAYHPALFEPHVQPEDLTLAEAEHALSGQIPALAFWQDTAGLAHVENNQVVSLNMLDVAMSAANNLGFEQRLVSHVREHVWGDVIIRYMRNRNLELVDQLTTEAEPVPIEEEVSV